MYRERYTNELYHFGIKGMKWGVRRYQNADGTLTAAGQKRYFNSDGSLTDAGHHRIGKMQKYRDKKAKRALATSERMSKHAKDAKATLKDIKKNGVNSEAYKERVRRDYMDWSDDYDIKNGHRPNYTDDTLYRLEQSFNAKDTLEELTRTYKSRSEFYTKEAKRWESNHKDLMNMPLSVTTTKKDIKETYKGRSKVKQGEFYVDG